MKIALVSTTCLRVPPRTYGGTELVIAELADGLVARGHEVTLYATADSETSATLRALYPEPRWPPDFSADLNHISWALEWVRREGADVVHVHSAPALAFARLLGGIPMVYTIHHVRDEQLSSFYAHFDEPWYVAISADQAAKEVPLRRRAVIHHGLDPRRFECVAVPGDYVCFIGRFARIKGAHTAIDVAGRAGVPIRVAGEVHPVDRAFAEAEILPRFALPHVRYVGCVGHEEKRPLLRDARALLAPIEWDEPFGLTIIEAMLSGCPVVAFPRGSVPELVEEGVTGFVVRDADEMVERIRPGGAVDAFDRARCRARAVERFGRSRMVAEYEALYRQAIAEATSPRTRTAAAGPAAG